jgi:hypothetical protein
MPPKQNTIRFLYFLFPVLLLGWIVFRISFEHNPTLAAADPRAAQAQGILENPLIGAAVAPLDSSQVPASRSPVSPLENVEIQDRAALRRERQEIPQSPHTAPAVPEVPSAPLAPAEMPSPGVSFEGLSHNEAGTVLPPDPVGAAGLTQYVQMVNDATHGSLVAIFNKTNPDPGSTAQPFGFSDLWPSGNPCSLYPLGDPVVVYDQLADRWILSQLTRPPAPPYYQCIAISKTANAVPPATPEPDGWYLYSFAVHPSKFNDYPKLSMWPDAYYMTANQFTNPFTPSEAYAGVGVWAFERDKMLLGQPARFVYFDLTNLNPDYFGLLPAGLLGFTPPPAGAPGYFASVDQDWPGVGTDGVLHLFEFRVNWANPAASTFAWVKDLVTQPFDWYISNYTFLTIPQPYPSRRLDDLADRLMMPLWYRNFGPYESLVANHTIDVNNAPPTVYGRAGVRWYEIRGGAVNTTLADATLYQQGDVGRFSSSEHRWMGSVAVDRAGNLALGYSVSSTRLYPEIRVTGRLNSDPPGEMPQGERTLQTGGGSQTSVYGRWGDYSAMTLDPVDDCTFWYTNEYNLETGEIVWGTNISSFRFPDCADTPGFLLSANPGELSICAGEPAEYSLLTAGYGGISPDTLIDLDVSGNPAGTLTTLAPNPVQVNTPGALRISNTAAIADPALLLAITGTSNSEPPLVRTTYARLNVFTDLPDPVSLVTPANNSTDISAQPVFTWIEANNGEAYTFELALDNRFINLVHVAQNIPGTRYYLPEALDYTRRYFWRVRAANACGDGNNSPVFQFTTLANPDPPVLFFPFSLVRTSNFGE